MAGALHGAASPAVRPTEAPPLPRGSPFLVAPDAPAAAALGYEHEELYTWDGLPPVHVGDTLRGGAYRVVAKLGSGSFSTVWAADHVASGSRVAIKLWRAADWTTEMAAEEHMYLQELAGVDPDAAFPVMRLLDSFVHVSAHGRHAAAVLELMGVSVRVALHAYLHRPGATRRRGAPVRVITTIVAAFWSPGGVPHAPGRVAIIDWGNTERLNEDYILPFSYQLQTESYRSPETIAGAGASPGTDLWSVGCMRRRLGHWEGRGGWVAVQLRTLLNVGWGGKVAGAATASAVTGR
ncbi:hypothetical protein I4F81_003181 [Pyropia yezoensis]|uniref:Uncharacterized protein n=1 Tax=Pyropia yezoensis TaxID=2788 RepID=A0ACC3BSL7_PYRYE|nr:hypothetical protein I4F81_003181 [Neopyropia yezoensis]